MNTPPGGDPVKRALAYVLPGHIDRQWGFSHVILENFQGKISLSDESDCVCGLTQLSLLVQLSDRRCGKSG